MSNNARAKNVKVRRGHVAIEVTPWDGGHESMAALKSDFGLELDDLPNDGNGFYFTKNDQQIEIPKSLDTYPGIVFHSEGAKINIAEYPSGPLPPLHPSLVMIFRGMPRDPLATSGAQSASPGRQVVQRHATPAGVNDDDLILDPWQRGLKVDSKGNAADTFENALYAIHASGLDPVWNVLSQRVELRGVMNWDADYGRTFNDNIARLVRVALVANHQGNAYKPSKENVHEAVIATALTKQVNPIAEYLDSLEWDGVERIAKLFGDYFHCGVDEYTRGVSEAWMIGAVRRVRSPGCKFDTMVVLKGDQGLMKSTGLRVLASDSWFSDADLGNLNNKDAAILLRGVWIKEFAEIDSMNRAEAGQLKAFLSRMKDTQRDPYDKSLSDVPRSCVFAATVNQGGYLRDTTGARRFWPLDVSARVDVKAIGRDRDQLWAEASAMEAAGMSLEIPESLWPVAAVHQAAQTADDPWSGMIADYIDVRVKTPLSIKGHEDFDADGDDRNAKIPSPYHIHGAELFDLLGIAAERQNKGQVGRIRAIMESLGWTYKVSVKVSNVVKTGYVRVTK